VVHFTNPKSGKRHLVLGVLLRVYFDKNIIFYTRRNVSMKNKTVIYWLALTAFLIGTIEYIITGIIQMVATDLSVSTSVAGLLVTSFALSAAIGAPIIIALTINFDRKKLLLSMLAIFILSNFITFFSHSRSIGPFEIS